MAASLNKMAATQSKMAVRNHNIEHIHMPSHPNQTIPEIQDCSLSENLLQRHRTSDPSTEISQVFKYFKGREGGQVERRGGRKQETSQTSIRSPATCRHPGITGLSSGPPGKGEPELGPTRNQTRPEQNQNSSSLPSRGDQPSILSSS